MKIALITADKFDDYELLKMKLDELQVAEIICGNSVGYELAMIYQSENNSVIVTKAEGKMAHRAYNAIKQVEDVAVFSNGTGHLNLSRTNLAIRNALKNNKNLYIYPYKSDAFDITKEDEYIKLDFKKSVKQAFNTQGVFLKKVEVQKLIDQLQKAIVDK